MFASIQLSIFCPGLLSKNMYVLNGAIIFHVVLYGCETWAFTLEEEHTVGFEGGREQEAGENIWSKIDEKQEA